jgi:predicted metal-dependent RNase
VPEIPEWVKELEDLTIIQESTYGDVSINSIEKKLDNYIINALKSNKNIVMPVISQERLELVLLTLKKLQEKKLLSTSVKIFIHTELGKEYLNKVYLDSNDIIDFMPKNTKLIARDDFKTALAYKGLKIILSSSGMADKGCVRYYLRNVLPREDYTVIFTCYTPKGSLGYKLRTATKGEFIRIDNQFVNLLCDVKHSGELSKHVKFEGIVYFINQFKHVKNILLTHGETKTKALLYNKLKNVYPDKNIFIMNRETGFKLDQNMDITTYPTNFKNDTEFIRKYSNQKKHSNAKNNKCNKHHYNKTIKKKYFNKK